MIWKARVIFHLDKYNYLTNCELSINFPVKLNSHNEFTEEFLTVEVILEDDAYPKTKTFSLKVGKDIFDLNKNGVTGMWFESQIVAMQKLLPNRTKINSCLFCAFSNYGVGGSNVFGTLGCYKEIKDQIILIKSKDEYMDVAQSKRIPIQETFYCTEYEDIKPGQWQCKDSVS